MTWFLFVMIAAALLFVLVEKLRLPMDSIARAEPPGKFATLSRGVTHYRWDGPMRGPVAVCVHGLTSSSYVYDAVVRGLTMMGFRVLRYDLYGRGLSDRPDARHGRGLYLQQLKDLLADQGIEGDLTLVGYSMGGSIISCFAAEEPHRVERVILLAPAGLGITPGALAEFCRKVPILGDWLMRVFGGLQIRRGLERGPTEVEGIRQMQADEIRYRGFLGAVLSSQRNILVDDLSGAHRKIAKEGIPVLAIWGGQDKAIPLSAMGKLAEINRNARQVELSEAGHGLPYTHPREIHFAISEFLREV